MDTSSTAAPRTSTITSNLPAVPPRRTPSTDTPARLVRQVEAISLWVAARRERERHLNSGHLSRSDRLDVSREIDALRRTHDTIKGRCATDLNSDLEPFQARTTAVIAHRHPWFIDKLAAALADCGVTVLVTTDNGAEALGAAVADQPDLLLAGESLAMMSGAALLAEARRFASQTMCVLQGVEQDHAQRQGVLADAVYPRHYSPAVIADALVALHLTTNR